MHRELSLLGTIFADAKDPHIKGVASIADKFHRTYKGKPNPLTPKIEAYGAVGNFIYEISSGDSIWEQRRVYGVTVLDIHGNKTDLNKGGFYDLAYAKEYIKALS